MQAQQPESFTNLTQNIINVYHNSKKARMFKQIKSFFTFNKKSSSGICEYYPLPSGSLTEYALGYGAGYYGRLTSARAMSFYRQSGSVANSVDIRAKEIENLTPVLMDESGKMDVSHPVLELLKVPNDYETYRQFIGDISRNLDITGNYYAYAGGTVTSPPVELYSIKPQNISIEEAVNQYPESYHIPIGVGHGNYRIAFTKNGARYYSGGMKEIYQFRGYTSSSNNIEGDSPLMAIANDINQNISGRLHNVKLLENGGRLTLVAQFKDTMDDDQHADRRQKINEQIVGAENAGKVAVISSADMELLEFGKSNRDMDYAVLQDMADKSTYMRFDIPLPLVSDSATTFNNMQSGIVQLYDRAVLPHADRVFEGLSWFLLPRFGIDPTKIRITYNPENITALQQRLFEQLKLRKEINIETANELRAALPNREPIPGADTLYQPAALIPVGTDIMTDDNIDSVDEL